MERRDSHIDISEKISNLDLCIATGFAKAGVQHESVVASIADIRKDQEKIIHVLYGNGKEGLITSVAKIAQKLNLMWSILTILALSVLTLSTGIAQDWIGKSIN